MNTIITKDLTYHFNSSECVLDSLNIEVPKGSIYGFLGPNGAGKTTTLKLLLGLLKRQQGSIEIFGKPLESNRNSILQQIGSLIESPSLYNHLTAKENLLIWQRIYQCPKDRIELVLELVGLSKTGKKKAGKFSLGMKQRLSIAIALLHQPSLLVLDEPTNGLDPNGILEMRELLKRINKEEGTTIVISSHLLAEVEKLVTHIGIIHHGKMRFQGTLQELKEFQTLGNQVIFATDNSAETLKLAESCQLKAKQIENHVCLTDVTSQEIAKLNAFLVQNHIQVYQISTSLNDLESIFMNITNISDDRILA